MDFTNKEYKEKTIEFAKDVINFLNKRSIPFFITTGTCLGYLRENDLIEHDNDFDFGVLAENWNMNAHNDLYSFCQKVEPWYKSGFNTDLPNQYGVRNPGVVADIYLYYKGKGKRFDGPSRYIFHYTGNGIFEHKAEIAENTKLVEFCGMEVYVPKNTKEFVEELYGKDWQMPKKKDDVYTDFCYSNFVLI